VAKATQPPPASLASYQQLVAMHPPVELKGATMPYTSVNGHMFSFLTPTGTLALRLPADARAAFLDIHHTRLCEQHGRVMKEYVEVPDALLARTSDLAPYFQVSIDYVTSLKPKAARR
jgi:hypothetical protein